MVLRKGARLLQELETGLGCKVIRNQQNLGIAVSLNRGIKYAIETKCEWAFTFEGQPSVNAFILKMLETYRQAPHPEKVALIAPTYVDRESGVNERLKRASDGEILAAMSSGSAIPASTILRLGYLDESHYMDAADTEFCLRARRKGMLILQSPAILLHSLGRTKYYRFLGMRFGVTNHSAGRRYYMTRNRLRLLMRYAAADWAWTWRESRTMLLDTVKIVLAEDNKWRKFRAMAAGTVDALSGKVGKQIEL